MRLSPSLFHPLKVRVLAALRSPGAAWYMEQIHSRIGLYTGVVMTILVTLVTWVFPTDSPFYLALQHLPLPLAFAANLALAGALTVFLLRGMILLRLRTTPSLVKEAYAEAWKATADPYGHLDAVADRLLDFADQVPEQWYNLLLYARFKGFPAHALMNACARRNQTRRLLQAESCVREWWREMGVLNFMTLAYLTPFLVLAAEHWLPRIQLGKVGEMGLGLLKSLFH